MTPAEPRKPRDPHLERMIRHRLLLGLVLVFLVLVVLVDVAVSRLTEDFVRSRLEHDGESLIASLRVQSSTSQGAPSLSLDAATLPRVYRRPLSGHYYILRSAQQTHRSRSLWDLEVDTDLLATGETRSFQMSPLPDQHWLVWQLGFTKADQPLTLWIAEDIAPLKAEQRRFDLFILGLVGLAIPVLLWWQRLILRRGFARLEPLRRALAEQQQGAEAQLPERMPAEVRPLAEAVRLRLERSGAQIQRSRTALGNLAHELKRPLQQLHWLLDECREPQLRDELASIHRRLQDRIERELRRARIAGAPAPGRQFDPGAEIPHLERLLTLSSQRQLSLHQDLPPGALPYDRDDLIELLGNLLDNAWRHARTGVWLGIRPGQGVWLIDVEDDGPGVPETDLQALSQRGLRLDEHQGEGQGLGLAICAAVVESYGGRLEFHRSRRGGLGVQVELPRPTA